MSRLDEIIALVDHVDNPFFPGGIPDHEAKQQIKDLIEGIVWESDEPGGPKTLRTYADIQEGLDAL